MTEPTLERRREGRGAAVSQAVVQVAGEVCHRWRGALTATIAGG